MSIYSKIFLERQLKYISVYKTIGSTQDQIQTFTDFNDELFTLHHLARSYRNTINERNMCQVLGTIADNGIQKKNFVS